LNEPEVLAAAVLHDTVEDTKTTFDSNLKWSPASASPTPRRLQHLQHAATSDQVMVHAPACTVVYTEIAPQSFKGFWKD
jgi:hypothetical protein